MPVDVRRQGSACVKSFLFGCGMRAGAHADGNYGLIVKGFYAGGVLGGGLEEGIDNAGGRFFSALADNLLYPSPSKEFSFAVARIENAVAEKHEHVSGLHAESRLIVCGFVEQAQWQAGGFDHFILTAVDEDRAGKSGVGN